MKRAAAATVTILAWAAGTCQAQKAAKERPFGAPISKAGGIEVYAREDFDSANPFKPAGAGRAALEQRADFVACGGSLHVSRAAAEGYFGAGMPAAVAGSKGLKIAFCARAQHIRSLAVNFRDTVQDDNTTPRSPLRPIDRRWMPVVFHVEDFRYNGGGSEAIKAETKFVSLMFHGGDSDGGAGEFWIDRLVIYRGMDTAPPGPPRSLRIKPGEGGRVELTWKDARDNAFPAVYSVHRRTMGQWRKVGETVQTRFTDTVPAPGLHTYRVTAADYENNVSRPAIAPAVSVRSAGKPAPVTDDRVRDRRAYANNVRRIHALGSRKARRDVFVFFGGNHTVPWAYHRTLMSMLGRGLPVLHGHPGKDTAFARTRIKEILATDRPQFAVILFGSSDEKDPKAVAMAMKNLSAVIDACVRGGAVPVLTTIPPTGRGGDQPDARRFNKALIRLCRDKKVPISYCFEEMMAGDLSKLLGEDGVSLRPGAGTDAAGMALRKTFDQIYFAIRDTSAALR